MMYNIFLFNHVMPHEYFYLLFQTLMRFVFYILFHRSACLFILFPWQTILHICPFILIKDDHDEEFQWQEPSRSAAWTPDNRARASERRRAG